MADNGGMKADNGNRRYSHRHVCDIGGHDYQCSEDCSCICGFPMNGFDHSGCPVELRACPVHKPEEERRMAEFVSAAREAESKRLRDEWEAALPHCECGCASNGPGEVVGWCLHCDHVYADYSPEVEDRHFAHHCPGVPEAVKQAARARLARHAP